jgi:hypothetical protein
MLRAALCIGQLGSWVPFLETWYLIPQHYTKLMGPEFQRFRRILPSILKKGKEFSQELLGQIPRVSGPQLLLALVLLLYIY